MPVSIKWFPPSWIQISAQGSSTRKQHKKGQGVGYLIMIDLIPEMRKLGRLDVALLPIGGKFTMDRGEAVAAAIAINPRIVIPMHRFETDPRKLTDELETRSNIKSIPLDIGEICSLEDKLGK
jgi:L-ascorbate metabolism protein UlaG (beta-lactamase superfamily)